MIEKIKNFFQNKVVKTIITTIGVLFSLWVFIATQTVINTGFVFAGVISSVIVSIIVGIVCIVKRKKIKWIPKEELINKIQNDLTLGLFINVIFIILLSLIVNEASYMYSFGNYMIYKDYPNYIYILSTVLIIPFLRNFLVRRNLKYIKKKGVKEVVSILFALLLLITSPTVISGIYTGIITFILNRKYIKEENILKTTITEILIALSLSVMTLYLSSHKAIVMTVLIAICLITFVINITKYIKNKETKKEEV